jgi:hypothetical protein
MATANSEMATLRSEVVERERDRVVSDLEGRALARLPLLHALAPSQLELPRA